VTLSVKVTEKERDELKARWGSAYVGLRKAVENLLGGEPTASAGEQRIKPLRAEDIKDKLERDIAATIDGNTIAAGVIDEVIAVHGAGGGNPVIVDSLDYPAGRGEPRKARHAHKPATMVEHNIQAGVKYETWACECGHVLTPRRAK